MKFRSAVLAFLFFVGFIGAGTSWADDNCDLELSVAGSGHDVARRPANVAFPDPAAGKHALRYHEYMRLLRQAYEKERANAKAEQTAATDTAGGE